MSLILETTPTNRPSAHARRSRRHRRVVAALVIYTVLGFLIMPAIIKWQLPKQFAALTHRQAMVKQVRVNSYSLSLTVRGLALTETNGTPFAGFDELYVNFQLSSLFRWTWTFSEIKLTGPAATVVHLAGTEFNFSDLLTNSTAAATNFALPPVLIQHLVITNAVVDFTDRTTPKPFHAVFGPTAVELNNLSTRPDQHGPYSVTGSNSDGEAFAWTGTVSLRLPQSRGEFKLHDIPPAKYGPYLAFFTTAQVAQGKLDISAAYALNAAGFPPQIEVTNLVVHLRDFELKSPGGGETLLTFPDLLVQNVSGNLTGATVRVPLVKLSGGSAFVRRDAQGKLEAEQYIFAPTNGFEFIRQFASNIQAGIMVELRASLDELSMEDFTVTAEDCSLSTVAKLGLDQLLRKAYKLSFNTTPEPALREALQAAVATNAPGVGNLSAPVADSQNESKKGAIALAQHGQSLSELDKQTRKAPAATASTGPSKSKTERELIREELERRLTTTVPVTDKDLHALLRRRTEVEQRFPVETGQIAADRLFPILPKPGDVVKGEARVVFSLN